MGFDAYPLSDHTRDATFFLQKEEVRKYASCFTIFKGLNIDNVD